MIKMIPLDTNKWHKHKNNKHVTKKTSMSEHAQYQLTTIMLTIMLTTDTLHSQNIKQTEYHFPSQTSQSSENL